MVMRYQDLEVEVSRCLCGKLEVRVLNSPFDRPRERFKLPYKPERLKGLLTEIENLILSSEKEDRRRLRRLVKAAGERMFKRLFCGEIEQTLSRCLAAVESARDEGQSAGLRIRLSFGEASRYAPEMVSLPWEMLRNPDDAKFLNRRTSIQIVRYLDSKRRIQSLPTDAPLKVLFVLASPNGLPPVDVERHREILQKAFLKQQWVEPRFLEPPTLSELRRRLRKETFHVLHFLGHGGFFPGGEGVVCFERADGANHRVRGTELAAQLEESQNLRLVVLTSCVGGQMSREEGQHAFTGAASALVAGGISAVVAMQFPISEAAASQFSFAFYESLAQSCPVDQAMADARLQLVEACEGVGPMEWISPILIMRTPDGRLLDLSKGDEPPPKVIAIFNRKDHGWEEAEYSDYRVDLMDLFQEDGRTIRNPKEWNGEVLGRLRRILNSELPQEVSYHLVVAAPTSVAFAAGLLLPAKAGRRLTFSQRGVEGTVTWDLSQPCPQSAARWIQARKSDRDLPAELPIERKSQDIAVAVSITLPSLEGMLSYLNNEDANPPRVRRVLHADLVGGPGSTQIANGSHAFKLADALRSRLHKEVGASPEATIHLFIAAPNVFTFFLGRLSEFLGRIQLYEWDRDKKTYLPSINLRFADGA